MRNARVAFVLHAIINMCILILVTNNELLEEALIALRRVAGALEGVEEQLECLCRHFGAPSAKPPSSKPAGNRKGDKSQ